MLPQLGLVPDYNLTQRLFALPSSVLVHTLAQHDLVDEYSLLVYPVVLGSGKQLFAEGVRLNLCLIESRAALAHFW